MTYASPAYAACFALLASLTACGGGDQPRSSNSATGGTSSGGSGASGGSGGKAGAGGAGGSGATPSTGGSSAGGAAGSGGSDPVEPVCTGARAFQANGAAFTFPTPEKLALTLGELAYDYDTHPLSIVLEDNGTAAVSVTEASGFSQVFPAGYEPDFATVALSTFGFASTAPQAKGWLGIDDNGPVLIELDNLTFEVTADDDCTSVFAIVSATIPASEGDKELDGKSITKLATGDNQSTDTGWPIHIVFQAVMVDFGAGP